MAAVVKKWQTTLNVVGSIVTVVTSPATGSQISSVNLMNTNSTTAKTVTIYVGGTGSAVANMYQKITIQPNDFYFQDCSNCPMILGNAETIRMCQDVGTDVTATLFGLDT